MKLNNNMAIRVRNKKENQAFLNMCMGWVAGIKDHYNKYFSDTVYHIDNFYLYYSDVNYCKENNIPIVEFKDIEK